jgi:hypothetical protein
VLRNLLAALFIFVSGAAAAAVPPAIEGIFGPEFTFTYKGSVSEEKRQEYLVQLRRHLKGDQPEGAKFTESNSSFPKFTSPNGWWFEVTTNPGVLEIKMKPMTVKETRLFKDDIQSAIFVNAAIVGLFPWDYLGGGHLNFDISIFGNRVLFARNFIVDFFNHGELAMGALSYDTNNAVPFALFNDKEQRDIAHVIALSDAGEFPDTEEGVKKFLSEINRIQIPASNRLGGANKGKHHDLNLGHAGRIEIRSVRPQANMDVWLNQIELIESRINNHLRHIDKPLPLRARVALTEALDPYVPPVDPQAALRSFYMYVNEARLDWKDHRGYVWPPWIRDGELAKFESSDFFKTRERQYSLRRRAREAMICKGLLKP